MSRTGQKKILIVDNTSWNIHNFRLPLIKGLKKEGFNVTVTTPIDEYIQYLNQTHFNKHIQVKYLSRQSKNPFQDFIFLLELVRIFKQASPDLVILFTVKPSIYGSLVARLLNIPSISVLTGLGYSFVHPSGLNSLVPKLMKWAFKKNQKVIVYNQQDWQELTSREITAAHQCAIVPGDGVDTTHYRPMPPKEQKDGFVFLFIGRLLQDKGIEEYVEAAKNLRAQYPNTECWVVGDLNFGNPSDIGRGQLLEWIEHKDIRYFATTKDIRQYICQCDVLVLPSYREGLPRVILEAMSMAKPIITTDVAGCKDAVKHGENGLIVPPRDTAALTEAMHYYRTTFPQELAATGERNRKKVMSLYTMEKSTNAFLNAVNEVFEVKSASRNSSQNQFSSARQGNDDFLG